MTLALPHRIWKQIATPRTAVAITNALRKKTPALSLTAVYHALQKLVKRGQAQRLPSKDGFPLQFVRTQQTYTPAPIGRRAQFPPCPSCGQPLNPRRLRKSQRAEQEGG